MSIFFSIFTHIYKYSTIRMKKKTTKEFISEASAVHGTKYDYSNVDYVNNNTPIKIICPEHGEFEQRPVKHLNAKQGCSDCGLVSQIEKQRKSTENFVLEAVKIHNNKYCYNKVEYVGNKNKVIIICPEHGEFEQSPDNHLKGKGCKYCGGTAKLDTKLFRLKAKEIHDDKYDYSKVNYITSRSNVTIICPEHGEFLQSPNNHLSKRQGCFKCLGKVSDTVSFVNRAIEVHGDKFDYSKVVYDNWLTPVIIICPEHGETLVTPNYHLKNYGCKKCSNSESLLENEVGTFIDSLGVVTSKNDRLVLGDKELDIYIPSHKLAIEFDGLYWHSELFIDKGYHLDKTERCEEKGIQLIHIFEDEWLHNKDIVKSRIKNILNLTKTTIYARKCEIKVVDSKTKREFLNDNHIQGTVGSKVNVGLYYNDELTSLMTFGHRPVLQPSDYELLRFCNKIDTTIVGGASRLLKYFIRNYNPKELITYADRRWSSGNLYESLKMDFIANTPPNFYYIRGKYRDNRIKYQKHKLVAMGFDETKTANEIMSENGYYRIYDCGHKKYSMKR